MRNIVRLLLLLIATSGYTQAPQNRWAIEPNGPILWKPGENLPHRDHLEMSGKFISAVIRYGVNQDLSFWINRDLVWPMLRTIPNNTHASLIRSFNMDVVGMISINRRPLQHERVQEVLLDGKIRVRSSYEGNIALERTLFPSTDLPAYCEKYALRNQGDKAVVVEIPALNAVSSTLPEAGVDGAYRLQMITSHPGTLTLPPGQETIFYLLITATKTGQDLGDIDVENELQKRSALIAKCWNNLVLETPDEVLNKAFAFAKIRAAESIYQTKGGPMHGPGGLSYYAAIWANDQAEYINPFFPYLGYDYGIESALNAYRHFARFMNDAYKPIPSSIIAEGTDIWDGAGDRGDAAMIAYGAARFALSQGDSTIATELWSLIEWCLEYNRRKLNPQGVVASDSDELEGRFPSGTANLCTSSLYYDALISAAYLGESLGKSKKQLNAYRQQAAVLKTNLEKYFGAKVQGYDTYRYYEGNDTLRAWICIPLTVHIFDRAAGTMDALFSSQLWTDDGLASLAGDKTFWDRSTLYALRGVLAAGDTHRGVKYLHYYANRRLLGEHVPYPVEAYPEGNQRHLSAESGLFCRVFTEGLFGIRPTSLHSFTLTPHLPDDWNFMNIHNLFGFQNSFNIEVKRAGTKIRVVVQTPEGILLDQLVENGAEVKVDYTTSSIFKK